MSRSPRATTLGDDAIEEPLEIAGLVPARRIGAHVLAAAVLAAAVTVGAVAFARTIAGAPAPEAPAKKLLEVQLSRR